MWKAFTIQPYGRLRIPATFPVDYQHFVLVFKNFQMGCASCVLFLLLGYIESLLFLYVFRFVTSI
jgi:hypothetical protein